MNELGTEDVHLICSELSPHDLLNVALANKKFNKNLNSIELVWKALYMKTFAADIELFKTHNTQLNEYLDLFAQRKDIEAFNNFSYKYVMCLYLRRFLPTQNPEQDLHSSATNPDSSAWKKAFAARYDYRQKLKVLSTKYGIKERWILWDDREKMSQYLKNKYHAAVPDSCERIGLKADKAAIICASGEIQLKVHVAFLELTYKTLSRDAATCDDTMNAVDPFHNFNTFHPHLYLLSLLEGGEEIKYGNQYSGTRRPGEKLINRLQPIVLDGDNIEWNPIDRSWGFYTNYGSDIFIWGAELITQLKNINSIFNSEKVVLCPEYHNFSDLCQ